MFAKALGACLIFMMLIISVGSAQDVTYKPGELIVRFAPKVTGEQLTKNEKQTLLTSLNAGTLKHSIMLVPGLSLVKLPEGVAVEAAISKLKTAGGILYVEPNYRIRLASRFPYDTHFDDLWGMHNTGQTGGTADADINAPEAWDTITDSDVIVAVIDSGVDYTHPDLAANMWINPGEDHPPLGIVGPEDFDGINDDGNGYIDDIYGYDFCTFDDGKEDPDPYDDLGHGTHCAGTIGAVGNNDEGVTGVCWNTKIMALKFIASSGYGWSYDAIKCIEYAVDNEAKVLSNSWRYYEGHPHFTDVQALKDAVEAAGANGVLFVAAAGNEDSNNDDPYPPYPASYDCNNIISVMATNHDDERAYYSNWGATRVDLAAPGGEMYYEGDPGGILSTVPGEAYEFYQGTSMATPHVAGACALIWAANRKLSHLEVKQTVLESVDELASLDGLCVTGGRLNLANAVSQWPLRLTKTDNVEDGQGVMPYLPLLNNLLEYTICYDACGLSDTNTVLTDSLPDEVDYFSSVPQGSYNSNTHTITWQVGTVGPDDSNCFVLKVKVNNSALPGGTIVNVCELAGDTFARRAFERTPVDCWAGNILYVDPDANEGGDGYSWNTAYRKPQDALDTSQWCDCYTSIWIAAGTYKPVESTGVEDYEDYSFELLEDIALFGHFGGIGAYETSTTQRNFADANNETILEGQIGQTYWDAVKYVVTAQNIEDAILDGFTIQGSCYGAGVLLDNTDVAIVNCKLKDNGSYGVYATNNSYPDIHNCTFTAYSLNTDGVYSNASQLDISYCIFDGDDWSWYGLEMQSGSSANIANCIFSNNYGSGIFASNGVLALEGCSFENSGGHAICIIDMATTLTSCSISRSYYSGISAANSDLTVERSVIEDSEYADGISLWDSSNLDLTASVVRYSGGHGVSTEQNSQTVIKNCCIHDNGLAYDASGIYLDRPVEGPLLRNNTICFNSNYGIEMSETGGQPTITNCIVYDNTGGDLDGCTAQHSWFADPCFISPDPNEFHLGSNSPCIDTGDLSFDDFNETDFDGECRIMNGNGTLCVDIGADEYYWPKADYDQNGIVNFFDFAVLAAPWRTEDADVNLIAPDEINTDDLAALSHDWLWVAPWSDLYQTMMSRIGTPGPSRQIALSAQPLSLSSTASQQPLTEADIEDLIDWAEDLWQTDEAVKDVIPESTWQSFLTSLKQDQPTSNE